MLHVLSTMVLILLGVGLFLRKRRPAWHLRFMIAAFIADVSLVIYIETTRQAVGTVVSSVRPLIWVHAGISLAVLGLYVVMITLGWRLRNGIASSRLKHLYFGLTFCMFRGLNYVTSFMV